MRIIFVRHGECERNVGLTEDKDSDLTSKGKIQAKHLGNFLKKENISLIHSSTMKRAKQTAEIISEIIHVPITSSLPELNEYSHNFLKSKLKIVFDRKIKRLKLFLKELSKSREENKTILIISHGIVNRIIMAYLLRLPIKKQLLFFQQYNTCVNSIFWNDKHSNWRMESMNDVSHLPNKLRENYESDNF